MGLLDGLSRICFGLLGGGAYLIPFWLLISAIRWRSDARAGKLVWCQAFGAVLIILTSTLWYTFGMPAEHAPVIGQFYALGAERIGGGLLGGLLGYALNALVSKVGTVISSPSVA